MKHLVIDTALGACTAAVFDDERALAVQFEVMTKGHQEKLGGMVRDAVGQSGLSFDDLDRIGVTVGPGSFTGLRVGLAFAQGLGAALSRPVVGLSALDALAASLEAGPGPVAALIDARRGQVYAKFFRNGRAVDDDQALSLEQAKAAVEALGGDVRLVGNGAKVLSEAFEDLRYGTMEPLAAPSATALGRLTRLADPQTHPAKPLYLRAPDATPPSRLPGQPRQPAS